MKKITSILLTLIMLATVFTGAFSVMADDEPDTTTGLTTHEDGLNTLTDDAFNVTEEPDIPTDDPQDKLQIKIDTVEAEPGDTVDVKIDLINNVTVSSVVLNVSWPESLTLINANYDIYNPKDRYATIKEPDKHDEDYNTIWTGVTSPYVFNWLTTKGEVKGDCTFVTLTFKVADDAKGELAITAEAKNGFGTNDYPFDKDGNDIPFEIVNGAVITPGTAEADTYILHSLDFVCAGSTVVKSALDKVDNDSATMKKGSVVTILGWAIFSDNLKEICYTVNGEEHACEDVYSDRPDVCSVLEQPAEYGVHSGFGLYTNYMDLLGTDELDIGTYEISIVARANGGSEKVMKTFTLEVVEELEPEPPAAPAITKTYFDASAITGTSISAHGWTGANYPITRLGYTVDGGEPVFGYVTIIELPDSDPVKEEAIAGKFGVRFNFSHDFKDDGLSEGSHTVVIVAELDDDAKTVLPLANVFSSVQNGFTITVEGETPVDPDPAYLDEKNIDSIWVDGEPVFYNTNVSSWEWLSENPITGDVQSIGVTGWAWIGNSPIAQFGYRLNYAEPVFSDAFLQERPDVQNAFGVAADAANGFAINPVDVSYLENGDHTITVLVKAADGTVLEIETVPFSIVRTGTEIPDVTCTDIAFEELKYDGETVLSGNVELAVNDSTVRPLINFVSGSVSGIELRGWASFSVDPSEITGFGYSIDGGKVVTGDFIEDRSAELEAAGISRALGFRITVPVSGLTARNHTVTAYYITNYGTARAIETETISVKYTFTVFGEPYFTVNQLIVDGVYFNDSVIEGPGFTDFIANNPISLGPDTYHTIELGGAVMIEGAEIEGFGYKLDDNDMVSYSGEEIQGSTDIRMFNNIYVEVIDIVPGEHKISLYVYTAGLEHPYLLLEVPFTKAKETVSVGPLEFRRNGTSCELVSCDPAASGDIVIPDKVMFDGEWLPVTAIIGFGTCPDVTSVEIPASVTQISVYGLRGNNFERLTVADGNPVYHSQGVCLIKAETKELVWGCANSVIPDDGSVTAISAYAFYKCKGLASIYIPDSVTVIGENAFAECHDLVEVRFPSALTEIGNSAFELCTKLARADLPDSVERIGDYAFADCAELEYVHIPNDLTEINTWVFFSCKKLDNVVLPESITSIGKYAFYGCRSLSAIDLPDGLTNLSMFAFSDCTSLKEVVIPGSLENTGWHSFNDCTGLTKVVLEEGIKTVSSFEGCTGLTSIYVPDGVKLIEEAAFSDDKLTSIALPSTLEDVISFAFKNCNDLETVYFAGTEEEWNNITIDEEGNEPLLNAHIIFNAKAPEFKTKCLVLSGSIGIEFYMDLSGLSDSDRERGYMEFTVSGETQSAKFDPNNKNTSGLYYGFACRLNALQAADTVTAVYHAGPYEVSAEYSVKRYIESAEKHADLFSDEQMDLVRSLADYCHYSQLFLSEQNNAAAEHTEMDKYYTEEYDIDALRADEELQSYALVKDLGESSVKKLTYCLLLDSTTSVEIYIAAEKGVEVTAQATFNGNTYHAELGKDGRYVIRINGISAHKLSSAIEVSGSANGEFSATLCAFSYARSTINSSTTSQNAKYAMAALYGYCKAAQACAD